MSKSKRTLIGWLVGFAVSLVMADGWAQTVDLKEGVEQLAAAIAKSVPEGKQLRVAVTDFPDLQGVTSDLGRYIAERLTTRLAQTPKFRVIERRRLTQVLAELRFGMSDLVDPAKAKQLGKVAGVEALTVGSLSDLGNTVEVDARIIEVETGNMVVAATATISKDDTVKSMQERGREAPAPPAGGLPTVSGATPAPAPQVAPGTVKYQEFPQFRVDIVSLHRLQNGGIRLVLKYTNKAQKRLQINGDCGGTTLIDDAGNLYRCSGYSGINIWASTAFTLSAGGNAVASFTFDPPPDMTKRGTRASFTSPQRFSMRPVGGGPIEYTDDYTLSLLNIELR